MSVYMIWFNSSWANFPEAYFQTSLAVRTFGTTLTFFSCVHYENCMLLELRHWTNCQSNIWWKWAKVWKIRARDKCVRTKFALGTTYDINCATRKCLAKQMHTKFTPELYRNNKNRFTLWKFLSLVVASGSQCENETVGNLVCDL